MPEPDSWDGSAREYDSFEKRWHHYQNVGRGLVNCLNVEPRDKSWNLHVEPELAPCCLRICANKEGLTLLTDMKYVGGAPVQTLIDPRQVGGGRLRRPSPWVANIRARLRRGGVQNRLDLRRSDLR